MAMRRFNCPTIASRDISQVDLEACLKIFKDSNGSIRNSINGKTIRTEMYNPISPNLLPVLKEWSRDLEKNDIDWLRLLNNIFTGITIVHWKHCHIFLYCPYSKVFTDRLNKFITDNIFTDFRDTKRYYFITCNHVNAIVNYLNITAKWYMSKQELRPFASFCGRYISLPVA